MAKMLKICISNFTSEIESVKLWNRLKLKEDIS